MNHTLRLGWHNNTIQKDFKVIREETTDIALTKEQVQMLKDVKLTGMQEIIRDRFIVGLKTGLRISDWSKFEEKARINKDGTFTIVNQKTGKEVSVPLSKDYYEMVAKYKGKLPKQYNSIVVNRHIKLIALKAGLTELVRVKITKGRKVEDKFVPLWQQISTHTGRRTAASDLLDSGVNLLSVGSMLGMTPQTIKRYDKLPSNVIAAKHKDNPFFS